VLAIKSKIAGESEREIAPSPFRYHP
jgi:hypothetical protein